MKQITFVMIALAAIAGVAAISISLRADEAGAPVFVTKIPPGYRDWRLISVAHEEGSLHSFAAVLGNDVAIKAYREQGFLSRTARSLRRCTTVTSRRRKTTKSLVNPNLSSPVRRQTFSLWSRTRRSTPRPVGGDSLLS